MRYPIIYSISTVNLIYHGNCDYKLNPYCTGFAGESGVGKSIIADLLQLIFVGEGAYESATHSKGSRPLHKLVQKRAQGEDGPSRGYVFANIQTGSTNFLIIGCTLESLAQQCTPFVIQQGEDFSAQLRSINRPISYSTFIDNNSVVAVTDLRDYMFRTQQVVVKVFTQRSSDYYKILWENDLVPIDIRKPTLLKDYAKILRSFSRSGELDKNPDNLESFLFGSEQKERIWKSYEQLLASVGRDKRDYEKNNRIIRTIEQKITGFRLLDNLLTEARSLRRSYQANEVRIARQNREAVEEQVKRLELQTQSTQLLAFRLAEAQAKRNLQNDWAIAIGNRCNQRRLQELPSFIVKSKDAFQIAETRKKEADDAARTATDNLRKADQVQTWLHNISSDYKGLNAALEDKRTEERHSKLRQSLWLYLKEQGQADTLRQLGWHKGLSALQVQHKCEEEQQTAADARRLASYTDLSNPNSLTNWALHRSTPLTLDQESVLAHFGQLDKWENKEERRSRFLETADLLINDKMITEDGDTSTGFWLCLAGTKEWVIRLLPEQRLFEQQDKDRVRELLATWNQKNEKQAEELEAKSRNATTLLNILIGSPQWEEAIPLLNASDINTVTLPDDFPSSSVDLDTSIDFHRKQSDLRLDKQKAITNENQANIRYSDALLAVEKLKTELNELQAHLSKVDRKLLATNLWRCRKTLRNVQQQSKDWVAEILESISVELLNTHYTEKQNDDLEGLPAEKLTEQLTESKLRLETALEKLADARIKFTEYQKLEEDAQTAYQELPLVDEISVIPTLQNVQDKEDEYKIAFRDLVREFLSSDEISRYRPAEDLVVFMQEVLPDEVRGIIRSTDEGQERLQSALRSINESIREIARLKLVELGQLIGEVRNVYDKYVAEIVQVQKYFRKEKTEITGGFRPYIATRSVTAYPVEWLDEFQRTAAEHETVRQLTDLVSIDDILYRAYSRKDNADPKRNISKLLDPLSYLKLEFEMKNDDGYINDGSSGQTFMAAALLNIARLSVIGRSGGPQTSTRGLRFMAVDEVDSLGSNYTNLLELAHKENFQVISLSVRPLIYEAGLEQRLYFLHLGRNRTLRQNLPPAMLSKGEIVPISTERFAPLPNLTLFDPLPPDATA